MAEILHPFLPKFRQILRGILIYISLKKNAFIWGFTPTIRHFETGLFKNFDYFVVIEIAFMDNQAQITETISRLDSEKVSWYSNNLCNFG